MPELTRLVYIDGEPAAFAIALPNINELIADFNGKLFPFGLPKLLWRLKVEGPKTARLASARHPQEVPPHAQVRGLSTYMYVEMNRSGSGRASNGASSRWTLEDNAPVNVGIKFMGGKIYKRYRVYERSFRKTGNGSQDESAGDRRLRVSRIVHRRAARAGRARGRGPRATKLEPQVPFVASQRDVRVRRGGGCRRGRGRSRRSRRHHPLGWPRQGASSDDDFERVNVEGTKNLLASAKKRRDRIKRFVYVSSLAAVGPSRRRRAGAGRPQAEPGDTLRPIQAARRAGGARREGRSARHGDPPSHGVRTARQRVVRVLPDGLAPRAAVPRRRQEHAQHHLRCGRRERLHTRSFSPISPAGDVISSKTARSTFGATCWPSSSGCSTARR